MSHFIPLLLSSSLLLLTFLVILPSTFTEQVLVPVQNSLRAEREPGGQDGPAALQSPRFLVSMAPTPPEDPYGQEIIVTVEEASDSGFGLTSNQQALIVYGKDTVVSSWWTIEDEETEFNDWNQLESFIEGQYGADAQTEIEKDALTETEIDVEDLSVENQILSEGTVPGGAQIITPPVCKLVKSCQKVYVRPIGYRNICKNQLECTRENPLS